MSIFYIDGKYVPEQEAVLPVTDLAVLRGYGVFDFLRTYNGVPFHLQEHLVRLERSARLIGLTLPLSLDELTAIISKTLEKNGYPESNIRLVVTGGDSEDGISPGPNPRLMVMVTKLWQMPQEWYRDGVKVITAHIDRYMPEAKSINYIPAILNLREAKERQAIESLYVNPLGYIKEGTTSNFFAFFGKTLVTPPDRILPGITRKTVLELASKEFTVEEREIHKDEVRLMDEAMLSSSNKEIVSVVKIDSVSLPGGCPGERVQRVAALFKEYTDRYGKQ